ncbi:TNFAIP3-interacting protein 1-like isoform X1 [Orbicella faveolata]|uniref:TNFAIP3-interacting protein 1-like isoform X1 n=1 Tax=Orbicella faveolata TaxID=48498 RepID=UPI0009E5CB7A|nr:TNFAIP3-interacting protein 1-like isoform X1 [Orbicella faveolata]XP_020624440.1 TNFAIP3-interacting protein 1-like isoform X1 [Orbicella faveolata]XP_020624442.1 TNFAIP3-interacting protein 1-like isoform X1 [Orbicella faveolata]XP_020624443.1 TNFAIP3-interacting protein 1-like isoform X1 [Orbicella faveolata]XP_020624444.1 TNFAIP3-interacting protein 1-like isoform X1 [Orbicella faveolata]XP_020624445.1 TNFAIP3-interacting protein 1-like isoform X1 [Orbicella faveolata]
MSAKCRDSSEHLNSSDEVTKLQREIEQLQQDNKVLHIRAQGVQVLGKVLQDSQESNARLQKEVQKLKSDLAQKGIDSALADLSVCTSINDDSQSTTAEQGDRYHLSIGRSTDNHDYVNVTTVSEPQSLSSGFPSLLPGDFHIKEIQAEFQHITSELDHLMRNAQNLRENIERLPGSDRDTELQGKLTRLNSKLNEYVKEARTRETLSSALLSEEEKLKTKLIAMEAEQASHENVVQQLKDKIGRSREEIEEIQGEVKFFEETVHVKREQELAAVAHNEPLSIGSETSTTRSTSDESIVVKTPLSRTGSEACETCGQYQRQLAELQRQLLLVKAEKDEALKLKEEILDVNHKWDEQYKLLSSASNKEIADLKNQIEMLKSVDNQRNPEIMEKIKALDDHCKQLESELQQKQLEINRMQLSMRNQSALKYQQPPAPQNTSMEQPLSHLSLLGAAAPRPSTPTQSLPSWPGTTAYGQQIPAELIDQIEVLKQQLRVYADDFATEREDRERNQAEKEKLREELDAVKEQLQTLEQQLQIYEEDFKREKREKESLQQQLRAKNSGGMYQYQDPLAQRARAVAEQQARVQAIREVHDRERERLLRGQQELQQQVYGQQPYSRIQSQYNPYGLSGLEYTTPEWQQQNYQRVPRGVLPPRGPIAHPASQRSTRTSSMYHGGEVQPDNDMVEDVVDSPADGNDADAAGVNGEDEKVVGLEECPRCLRKFDGEDSNTILKHIERCIS